MKNFPPGTCSLPLPPGSPPASTHAPHSICQPQGGEDQGESHPLWGTRQGTAVVWGPRIPLCYFPETMQPRRDKASSCDSTGPGPSPSRPPRLRLSAAIQGSQQGCRVVPPGYLMETRALAFHSMYWLPCTAGLGRTCWAGNDLLGNLRNAGPFRKPGK